MNFNMHRDYNCKDEELPVVCGLSSLSLTRDQADFAAYSPRYTPEFVTNYKTDITSALELVEPKSETMEQKLITRRMYFTLGQLSDPISHLSGYLKLANSQLNLTSTDFGITHLRRCITKRDVEGAMKGLQTIIEKISRHREPLYALGLSDDLVKKFTDAADLIAADKQKQYDIITNRRMIVESNIALLNGLNTKLNEILAIGKILYKSTSTAKAHEYTFADLKKQVRRASKTVVDPQPTVN